MSKRCREIAHCNSVFQCGTGFHVSIIPPCNLILFFVGRPVKHVHALLCALYTSEKHPCINFFLNSLNLFPLISILFRFMV